MKNYLCTTHPAALAAILTMVGLLTWEAIVIEHFLLIVGVGILLAAALCAVGTGLYFAIKWAQSRCGEQPQ
jgi:hypothetical protein